MKVGIIGITGKVGKVLTTIIPIAEQNGGVSRKTSDQELEKIISSSDVLIDFSAPGLTLKAIGVAAKYKIPVVTGTTSIAESDFIKIKELSKTIPILHASNFSIGIQLMAVLVKKCAKILPDFDFSIIDKHHNKKKDSPSGTALFLAQQASKKAQIVSLREGNIFGEHICDFAGENEMVSISHQAFNREIFAVGALKCARWIIGRDPKLYQMFDCLEDLFNV